jgi:hypothetical protein
MPLSSATLVGAMTEPSAHYVVRVRHDVDAARWWSAAADDADAPAVIQALLAGRSRVEVGLEEALEVRAWASRIDGWKPDGEQPLSFYPATPTTGRTRDIVG